MVFRAPKAAPESLVPADRRGHLVGRFCRGCNQIFPLQRRMHSGDPIFGRDHVASPCPYEGQAFEPGAPWWDRAVEVMPAPVPAAAATAPAPPAPATPAQPQTTSAPQQGQPAPAPPK
jgi:hypothetical protein